MRILSWLEIDRKKISFKIYSDIMKNQLMKLNLILESRINLISLNNQLLTFQAIISVNINILTTLNQHSSNQIERSLLRTLQMNHLWVSIHLSRQNLSLQETIMWLKRWRSRRLMIYLNWPTPKARNKRYE